MIIINLYISKPSFDNKSFYVESKAKLLNILSKNKNPIKIPGF